MAADVNTTMVQIGMSYVKPHLEGIEDLQERLRVAMREAKEFWMTTDDTIRFKVAVGAVLLVSNPAERDRIERSLGVVNALSAAMSGVPVNMEAAIPADAQDLLPLIGMWRDAGAPRPSGGEPT